ncbi:Uncharacterised protein [Legionella cherrii]|uniref:Uncharacterized protein n=1 Tax=Legionella cherrii TaxID=28084 RepID=A0ABY6T7G4_9GAMM|nr:Uncharacterised protein [Legionella cherrii]
MLLISFNFGAELLILCPYIYGPICSRIEGMAAGTNTMHGVTHNLNSHLLVHFIQVLYLKLPRDQIMQFSSYL